MPQHKVYFLRRADGLVKIGTTIDLQSRLRALTKAHGPLEVVRLLEGDVSRERRMHHRYRAHRQFGEWFALDSEAIADVRSLPIGPAIDVTVTEQRIAWEAAEAEMAGAAAIKTTALITYRATRHHINMAQAVAELSAEYGLPVSFLTHLHKRKATTISAHGFNAIRAALQQEMIAYLADLEAEMVSVSGESIGAVQQTILAEVEAQRASLNAGKEVTR